MINMKSMCDRKELQTNSTTSPVIFIPFLTKCYLLIQIPKILTSLFCFPSLQAQRRKWFLSRSQRGHIYMAPHDVMRKSCCREFRRKTSRLPVLPLFSGSPASAPLQVCFLNHRFGDFISTDLFVSQFSFSIFESGGFQGIILPPDILPYIKWLCCCLLRIFALQVLL